MYRRFGKRIFDALGAGLGLALLGPLYLGTALFLLITEGRPVFFTQVRIGRGGRRFRIIKFRTMNNGHDDASTVTTKHDARITSYGPVLRRWKLDEIPQLWNVLMGDMSFVGPRPDVPGYYDLLLEPERRVLLLRPGITGPATLKYAEEETLLSLQADPARYNDEVIFPDKVRINLRYLDEYGFRLDLHYIRKTFFGRASRSA